MAEFDKPKTQQEIENELSVGKFAGQQFRTIAFTLGGALLGYLGGKGLAKTGLTGKVAGWLPKSITEHASDAGKNKMASQIIQWGGTAVGYVVGQIASLYEHWVKVERERLSVEEINKDVANLMEKRVQFEDTLDRQHKIVSAMLEKHEALAGQNISDKILADKAKAASTERTYT